MVSFQNSNSDIHIREKTFIRFNAGTEFEAYLTIFCPEGPYKQGVKDGAEGEGGGQLRALSPFSC